MADRVYNFKPDESAGVYDPDVDRAANPSLQALEEQKTEAAGGAPKVVDATNLARDEAQTAQNNLYNPTAAATGGAQSFSQRLRGVVSGKNRKRAAIGGGIVGLLTGGGLMGFSIVSGPLQFIHIAQNLSHIHFGNNDDTNDSRIFHSMRWAGAIKKGSGVERTRLGIIGNKLADKYTARLKAAGFVNSYDKFGRATLFIEPANPVFERKSNAAIIEDFKKQGVEVSERDGRLVVNTERRGAIAQRALTRSIMRGAGVSKISSYIGARLMCKRNGCGFHILRKLAKPLTEAEWLKGYKDRLTGKTPPTGVEARRGESNAAHEDVAKNASGIGKKIAKPVRGVLTAVTISGILCILQDMAHKYEALSYTKVVIPIINAATGVISIGSQIMNGQVPLQSDIDKYSKLLYGKDESGDNSSWSESMSYRANTGDNGGQDAPPALKEIGTTGVFQTVMASLESTTNKICTLWFQAAETLVEIALAFVTAGTDEIAIQGIQTFIKGIVLGVGKSYAGGFAAGQGINYATSFVEDLITGSPFNPETTVGAEFGSTLDYGSRLAANSQASLSGGRPLSTEEEGAVRFAMANQDAKEMSQKSIAYRLFNVHDSRSLASKVIDTQKPGVNNTLASLAAGLTHIGGQFGTVFASLFSKTTHAATVPYKYPFPMIGFTDAELNDPRFDNPYDNGSKAAEILDADVENKIRDKIPLCFGQTVEKVDDVWTVKLKDLDLTSEDPQVLGTYQSLEKNGCDGSKFTTQKEKDDWQVIRFFILDSVNANSDACYEGDEEACVDVGMKEPSTSGAPGSFEEVAGDSKALAKILIESPNVTFQEPREKVYFQDIVNQGSQIAGYDNGQCGRVAISPKLLGVLVQLTQTKYKIVIGVVAQGHLCDGLNHPKGKAIDLNGVAFADGSISTGNRIDWVSGKQMDLMRSFYTDTANLLSKSGTGGIGQIQCFNGGTPAKVPKVVYFEDACTHLHVDVGDY